MTRRTASLFRFVPPLLLALVVIAGHHALAQSLVPTLGRLPAPSRFAALLASFVVHASTALWILPRAVARWPGQREALHFVAALALSLVFVRTLLLVVAGVAFGSPFAALAVGAVAGAGALRTQGRARLDRDRGVGLAAMPARMPRRPLRAA